MRLEQVENNSQQVQKLWSDCFHDTKAYMDFYFDYKTRDNIVIGQCEEGQLISMVQLNPYQLSVHGQVCDSYYIVGVATKESHRKRGYMRRLLTESMEFMYDQAIPFTYLMPAKEAIYLPFDFRIVTTQKRTSIPLYEISSRKSEGQLQAASLNVSVHARKVSLHEIARDDDAMKENLAQFANHQFEQTEEIYTVRDAYYYERMVAEMKACGGRVVVALEDEEIVGYVAYAVEGGKLEVLEMLCDADTESMLLEQLEDEVMRQIDQEQILEVEPSEAPPIMARIIHMEAFLRLLRSSHPQRLVINVEDPILVRNQGVYEISCDQDSCQVTKKAKETYEENEIDLSGDIAWFISYFMGSGTSDHELKITQIHLNEIV